MKDHAVYRNDQNNEHLRQELRGCHVLIRIEKEEEGTGNDEDDKAGPYELPRLGKQAELGSRYDAVLRRRKEQHVAEEGSADADGDAEEMKQSQKKLCIEGFHFPIVSF